jgi:signal transduction histidine kinase
MEEGRLGLELVPTDLAGLVRAVAAAEQARTSRHTITVRAPDDLVALVDPLRFEQVVTNLVENAVKFSPNGGPIDVDVSTTPDPSADLIRLTVTDAGIGIEPGHREQVFERFSQAGAGDQVAGLGLGLYLSRRIVELHGGRIRVEAPAAGGTRLVVTFPLGLPRRSLGEPA